MRGESEMNNIKTGSFISALRKSKGLTQQELSIELGVTNKTVSKWECGDALPEIQTLLLISDYFEISVDEILRGEKARPTKNITQETETRFQVKKDRFIKRKLLTKITILYWISIGLLVAGLVFIGLFMATLSTLLFIFGVLFILSSIIIFAISSTDFFYEDDDNINKDIFTSIHATKFYFKFIYYTAISLFLFLVQGLLNHYLVSIYFYITFVVLSFIVYYYIRYKRYNYLMPKFVERILLYQTRYNLMYLLVIVSLIIYIYPARVYSYNVSSFHYDISFIDILFDQSIFLIIIFLALIVLSIIVYIFGQFKHKTFNIEMIIILIIAISMYSMSILNYREKLNYLDNYVNISYGYSGLNVQLILYSAFMSLIYFVSIPVIKKLRKTILNN